MTVNGGIQIMIFVALVAALVKPLGGYMTRVFNGERTVLSILLRPVERIVYGVAGVDEKEEQHWLTYTVAMLAVNAAGFVAVYLLQRLQDVLPLNPAGMAPVAPDLAFNTAISFVTNTNWQNCGGESTMSYLVQMAGFTVQNFLSAATGIVLAIALIRGFSRASSRTLGNFGVDLTRVTLYVLLPISIVFTPVFVWQGIPQTFGSIDATTLEGGRQSIAVGPVASQVAIKMLGTNGGGFFNADPAHPFENPMALSNRIRMLRDEEVKLSLKEYDILRLLVQHAGTVPTHSFMLGQVWGDAQAVQYLRVYVRQRRQKIGDDPERPRYIHTETGVGCRMAEPE